MYEKTMVVNNPTGLHARPASMLVRLASKFKSAMTIRYNDKIINARSVLSVMGAGISSGSQIIIMAEGEDEQAAVDAVCDLIEQFSE